MHGATSALRRFTPVDLPGARIWLDPAGAALNGSTVASVPNRLDAAYCAGAAQATPAAQPPIISSWRNGRPALSFDGTRQLKTAAFASLLPQPTTLIIVAQATDRLATRVVFDGIDATHRQTFAVFAAGTSELYAGASRTGATNLDAASVLVLVCNGASSAIYRNGALIASGNAGTLGLAGLTIAGNYTGTSGWWSGVIADFVVCASALSVADISRITGYFREAYAI